jgi:hypothetical protein
MTSLPTSHDNAMVPVIKDPSNVNIREMKPLLVAPTIAMVVEPTCRYGHGLLAKQPSTYLMRKTAGIFAEMEGGTRYIVPSRTSFAVTLWRCPACAYLELFDPDEPNAEFDGCDTAPAEIRSIP